MKNHLLKSLFLFGILSLTVACSKNVTMTRLMPAAVTVPSEIQKIVILDRTKPQNEMVSVIEGLITGELPFEVRNAIEATLSSLQQTLNTSPRYEVVRANQRLTGGMFGQIFPSPLDWYTVERICQEYQADAVLVLENFNSDFVTTDRVQMIKKTVGEGKEARTVEVKGVYMEGLADVSAGFRLYDPIGKNIIDQQRFQKTNTWSAEAETKTQALALLIAKADATRIVGELAGAGYAAKIAPMYVNIDRGFFPKSKTHPAVAEGARYAEVDQWEQAIETWESAIPEADQKTGGMLLYNIAVGYELLGSLDLAKDWAGKAYTQYGLKKAKNYVRTLDQEIQNANLLNHQMTNN
ncbi:hypothetical protein SAMN04488104_10094 [Algoriphagus faecimaris]|uniref:Tetratricopeptide repeat-containing protein n=1 Tax=Algoriphagus faecimaris TaxID=686796 RepID=A0A1G6QFI6_9BACT|nr:DUF6340 family protein [Algoriphagus faecimaris]SDC90447.1 hypothetical protein SAMN04488104_10094 [Algoriphagus faecimaris]